MRSDARNGAWDQVVSTFGSGFRSLAGKLVLELLDRELATRRYVAGDRYTIADITMQVAVDFMKPGRLSMPEGATNVKRWHAEVSARPSAIA